MGMGHMTHTHISSIVFHLYITMMIQGIILNSKPFEDTNMASFKPTQLSAEEPDFFDSSLTDEAWFLKKINEGRFTLMNNDTTIYDNFRDIYFTPQRLTESRDVEIDNKNKRYFQYHISKQIDFKKTIRSITLHRFIYVYHTRTIIPKHYEIIHKDGDKWNNHLSNLKLVPQQFEEEEFFNKSIKNVDWFYSQIVNGRFKLLNNDTIMHDTKRDIYTDITTRTNALKTKSQKNKYLIYFVAANTIPPVRREIKNHQFIWMYYNQKPIPDKHHIHHIDGDRLNNHITNLELISNADHAYRHYYEDGKHKSLNSEESNKASLENRIKYHALKNEICYRGEKICSKCKRMLPFDQFDNNAGSSTLLKLVHQCKECRSLQHRGLTHEQYKFPEGMLSDSVIISIRFKFHICNWTFNRILDNYSHENITPEQLHDILVGSTYTHLNLMHGTHDTKYTKRLYITDKEAQHIKLAKLQGNFTTEELCTMYGRSKAEIMTLS